MGSSLLSFFKGLFSTSSIVESGVKMLDSSFFTDQERSKFMLEWMKATAPMAKSRRFIALAITFLWTVGVLFCGFLLFNDSDKFDRMNGFMADNVNTPFSIILGFYFLAHVVNGMKK